MKVILFITIVLLSTNCQSQSIVTTSRQPNSFILSDSTNNTSIYVDPKEEMLVKKAATLFSEDIERVTNRKPAIVNALSTIKNVIIIGTLKSSIVQQLIHNKKINPAKINGKWEAFTIQVIHKPFKDVDKALLIIGSDRRGTAYGVFEMSQQIGVSPWYWWADVPPMKKKSIYINSNSVLTDAPKVKYRGIFINDEAPALSNWSKEKFGGFNHQFYEKVFELILRLKGNYLWPAMWGNAFYDDDSLNIRSADEYGIVIGTSHHEPLMRAHDEWRRYGAGPWDYDSNATRLKEFWRKGMERATNEKIVSIGMRGDGDKPMSRETATALLERIVKDQRNIIEEVTHQPASSTPQLWALYKEVQDYYDKGMRVPDDVTLLLCDDNWGNIRKLPKPSDPKRKGGYGIYYHFDYVGGPRNYKWINTNNLSRVWEQMHLAYAHGVDRIWIVNVGDIKPMELPISFFLDYAWDPSKWTEDNIHRYYTEWARKQFGEAFQFDIGNIIRTYSQYAARRKPELLNEKTYSIFNYNESDEVVQSWKKLLEKAINIKKKLPAFEHDAFYQLVLHPVWAMSNLYEMYQAVARNHLYAIKNHKETNQQADKVKRLYLEDERITSDYHRISNGKWNHMMDQTHIGYTYWQQPDVNKMPDVDRIPDSSILDSGNLVTDEWKTQIPAVPFSFDSKGNKFIEVDGCVSIEAAHWTQTFSNENIRWKIIPDIGRNCDGITTFPVTAQSKLSAESPHADYEFYTYDTGSFQLKLYFSPTLNIYGDEGLKYAISIDNGKPETYVLNEGERNGRTWEKWVADNIIIKSSTQKISERGKHVLRYWMISPAIVLQKIVLDFGGERPSYLGPPETKY